MLYLHDELGIAKQGALVPPPLAPLLALMDGARDAAALRSGMLMRTGAALPDDVVREIIAQLDAALLLENGAYQAAAAEYTRAYRSAKHRPPSHADAVYPSDPARFAQAMDNYCAGVSEPTPDDAPSGALVGMLCPHIDYARGHKTYAALWQRAKPALDDVEFAVILGTDHSGGLGAITPTRQSYATPLGVLPTDTDAADSLADALGVEFAFAEELHHVKEHSIELATVWLHHFIGGRACPILPILCGSFHHFISGRGSPSDDERIGAAVECLRRVAAGRRTLVIAAGDLAHMGPAFGDVVGLDAIARAKLTADDGASLARVCDGDGDGFFDLSRRESDARRVCGLSPIYLALELLRGRRLRGESMGYDQCPADERGASVVSIAGALLYDDAP